MSMRSEHHTVPLSVLLKCELENERIERPEIVHGQASQSKKGEDFTLRNDKVWLEMGSLLTPFSGYLMDIMELLLLYTLKENLLNNVLGNIPSNLNRDEWVAALPRALVAGFVKTDKH